MTDAGEWLISTAKRNPEALLVLAAGCALLMRSGRSSYRAAEQTASGVSGSNEPLECLAHDRNSIGDR